MAAFRLDQRLGPCGDALDRCFHGPRWWEWAEIPAGFLIANFVEWMVHRVAMRHPLRPLTIMYEKHTEHHRVFTHDAMVAASPADFDMVLFEPAAMAFFLLGLGLPIALLFFALVSWNAGWIFAALAVDYYVLYEYCHLAYHLPPESWVGRLPAWPYCATTTRRTMTRS